MDAIIFVLFSHNNEISQNQNLCLGHLITPDASSFKVHVKENVNFAMGSVVYIFDFPHANISAVVIRLLK